MLVLKINLNFNKTETNRRTKNCNEETNIQNHHGKSVQTFDLTTKQRFHKTMAKLYTTNPKMNCEASVH